MKLFDVYSLFDVNIVRGKGCFVYDRNNMEYLDLYGGHAVISIGHAHPYYIEKVAEQLNRLVFYSNSVINDRQRELAVKLGKLSGYDNYSLFLSNSGAEANENAIKLASFFTGRKRVLSFNGAFHGRTEAAVMASDNGRIVSPANFNPNYIKVPLNDMESVAAELRTNDYCAVIIEGIQGVGGIRIPDGGFMKALRKECSSTGTILILDEIQSGCGRTGRFFAHQHWDISADIVTLAKGIGNGFPAAATVISDMFVPVVGQLGTTFGGNHLACAAACAVMDVIERENLMSNAENTGKYLIERLGEIPQICAIRGMGLMIGIDFDCYVKRIRERLLYNEHVFTGVAGDRTLRLLPPLCLSVGEADLFMEKLVKCIN